MSQPSLDATAIGLRYVELEAIRRELEAERKRTVDAIQELLTQVQRTKISALQEVLRTQPLACEAMNHHLMAPAPPVAPEPPGGITTFLLGNVGGCVVTPGVAVRRGQFLVTNPGQP
jgi:hypothetical protein